MRAMIRIFFWAALAGGLSCATASAQIESNTLCIHNGSETWVSGPFFGYPNHGGGKYFPSFAHWASASKNEAGAVYPWKISGWCWRGKMDYLYGPTWVWETCLMKVKDQPYATSMSFDYPALFLKGMVPVSGPPDPIYSGTVPTNVPAIGGNAFIWPSSMGGFDPYLNIFAVVHASWMIPSG